MKVPQIFLNALGAVCVTQRPKSFMLSITCTTWNSRRHERQDALTPISGEMTARDCALASRASAKLRRLTPVASYEFRKRSTVSFWNGRTWTIDIIMPDIALTAPKVASATSFVWFHNAGNSL